MTPYWKDKHLPKQMIDALDVSNKRWYTNGKDTIYLDKDSQIPNGYYSGRAGHYGHPMSEEAKQKLREKAIGRHASEETKQKLSKKLKCKKYKLSDQQHKNYSKNASNRNKGRHWFTNGIKNVFTYDCPEGYKIGYKRSLNSHKK